MSKKRRAKIPPFRVLNSENIFRKFVSKIMRSCDKNFAQLHEALKDMHQKENSYIKAFESKVIMYLFEDVMKMRPENIFIGHHKKNGKMIFSEICKAFEQDGEGIFGIDDLENI